MWVRIGQIFSLQAGKNITSANIYEQKDLKHPYLCYGGNGVRGYVSSFNREGHFALIGRQGALCGNINVAKGKFYATEHAVVVDHFNQSDVKWGEWFLKALNLNQYATATAQPGLAVSTIIKVLIPLPPLAEQKRIVSKIEELLPLVDRYEQAWTKLEDFNRRFPEDMKKSILQQAIQGKLVEQRPEEGTAQELYAQIQAEKQRLIKEGKLKKEKPLPEITEDEKPFDIPNGWMWVRLLAVVDIATNLVQPSDYLAYPHIAPDNIEKGTGKLLDFHTVEEDKVSSANHLFFTGQILYSKIRPLLRKAVIAPFDGLCSADMYPLNTNINRKYLLYYLLSDGFNFQIAEAMSSRVKMPKINQTELIKVLLPLPPLAEQKRIVARLEELLPLCERLK